jgi:hypothetical protein
MGASVLVVHAFAPDGIGSRPSGPVPTALAAEADAVPVYWGPDAIPVAAADGFDAAVLAPDG